MAAATTRVWAPFFGTGLGFGVWGFGLDLEHMPMAASTVAMRFEDRFRISIESFAPMFSGMRRILFLDRSTLTAPYGPCPGELRV